MPRPREFDIDDAVEKAMHVFWEKGYNGTSLPDLLDGMGIVRGSLYKAFGSKKALFLRTLHLYDTQIIKPAEVMLRGSEMSGEDRLAAVFNSALERARNGDRRGCLLCNTAAEVSSEDDEIADIVNDQLGRLTEAFSAALSDTMVWYNKPTVERQAEARSLALNYVGLRVMARGKQEMSVLDSAAERTLQRIGGEEAYDEAI